MRVSCPTCDEHPVRRNPFQGFLQRGSNKRIVQRLVDHNIVGVTAQFRQKRPPFRMPLKAVSRFAAVSNPDDLAGLLTHHGCQQIDALNYPLQIVLGWTIAVRGRLFRPRAQLCDVVFVRRRRDTPTLSHAILFQIGLRTLGSTAAGGGSSGIQ
jgi:hypothetical protein